MSRAELIVGIYELDGFEGRVTYSIKQLMTELEVQARNQGIFIAGWDVMEDELRFVLMLRGKAEKCEEFIDYIETQLIKLLKINFGLGIRKLVVSRVTDATPPPEVLTDLRLDVKKIFDFQRIFQTLGEDVTVRVFQQVFQEKKQNANKEIIKRLIILGLFEEDPETGMIYPTPVGFGVQKFLPNIRGINETLQDVLKVDCSFSLLYLIESLERRTTEEKLLELAMLLFQLEPKSLEEALHFLEAEKFVCIQRDETLRVTEKGTEAFARFSTLMDAITEEQKEHNVVSKAFNSIDSRVKYVVKRNGTVEEFTFGRILESLIRGGVEYDISFSTVDALSDLFGLSYVVGAYEIVTSIKRKLTEHDSTRERTEHYSFYVNTHAYLCWRVDDRVIPFDRPLLEKQLVKRWFTLPNFAYSSSVVKTLTSKIFDGIRGLHEAIIPNWVGGSTDLPIELPTDFILGIIDYIVSRAIPVLAHFPHKRTAKLGEPIYQLTHDRELLWSNITSIIRDEIQTGLEDFKKAQKLLSEELVHYAAHYFQKGTFKLLSNLLIFLNAFPGLGFLSCASLLQVQARKLRADPTSFILYRSREIDSQKLLRSLEEFARRSMQIYMLQERSLEAKRTDLVNIVRFGINLSEKLLKKLKN
ncbi:MAG: hypothetical protein ACE5R6_01445 [Candidatus Heimdallarchaeota archaeon]